MITGVLKKVFNIVGENQSSFLWTTGRARQGKDSAAAQGRWESRSSPSLAFLNLQTTVVPAQVFVPSHHKECAISFKAQVTVVE